MLGDKCQLPSEGAASPSGMPPKNLETNPCEKPLTAWPGWHLEGASGEHVCLMPVLLLAPFGSICKCLLWGSELPRWFCGILRVLLSADPTQQ